MKSPRVGLRTAAVVVASVLVGVLAGCGSSTAKNAAGEASAAAAAASSAAAAASKAAASGLATAKAVLGVPVPILIHEGKVTAPGVVHLKKGDKVRLLITTDKADKVHVHLDDSLHPIATGTVNTIEVTASSTGRFEVETDPAAKVLTILEVT